MFFIRARTWAYRETYPTKKDAIPSFRFYSIRLYPEKFKIVEGESIEEVMKRRFDAELPSHALNSLNSSKLPTIPYA